MVCIRVFWYEYRFHRERSTVGVAGPYENREAAESALRVLVGDRFQNRDRDGVVERWDLRSGASGSGRWLLAEIVEFVPLSRF